MLKSYVFENSCTRPFSQNIEVNRYIYHVIKIYLTIRKNSGGSGQHSGRDGKLQAKQVAFFLFLPHTYIQNRAYIMLGLRNALIFSWKVCLSI